MGGTARCDPSGHSDQCQTCTTLPAALSASLIWPLHFLRPWRSRWARVARLCVAGLVAAWVVPVGLLSTAGETALGLLAFALLWLLAFALTTAVIRLCDAIWSGVAREGVPDGVTLLANASKPIPEYAGRGDTTVGIALSGGGYRASIFAIGALMYVRDAISVAPGRRVAAVCSVSGGSVTNAVIAHSGSLDGQDGGAFDRAAGELLRHATGPGSMFRGLSGLYYFGLPTLAAFIGFVWFSLRHIPIATLGRAACIFVITMALVAALVAALELILAATEKAFAKRHRRRFWIELVLHEYTPHLVSLDSAGLVARRFMAGLGCHCATRCR